jgi:hypothetical protein
LYVVKLDPKDLREFFEDSKTDQGVGRYDLEVNLPSHGKVTLALEKSHALDELTVRDSRGKRVDGLN